MYNVDGDSKDSDQLWVISKRTSYASLFISRFIFIAEMLLTRPQCLVYSTHWMKWPQSSQKLGVLVAQKYPTWQTTHSILCSQVWSHPWFSPMIPWWVYTLPGRSGKPGWMKEIQWPRPGTTQAACIRWVPVHQHQTLISQAVIFHAFSESQLSHQTFHQWGVTQAESVLQHFIQGHRVHWLPIFLVLTGEDLRAQQHLVRDLFTGLPPHLHRHQNLLGTSTDHLPLGPTICPW